MPCTPMDTEPLPSVAGVFPGVQEEGLTGLVGWIASAPPGPVPEGPGQPFVALQAGPGPDPTKTYIHDADKQFLSLIHI